MFFMDIWKDVPNGAKSQQARWRKTCLPRRICLVGTAQRNMRRDAEHPSANAVLLPDGLHPRSAGAEHHLCHSTLPDGHSNARHVFA